LVGLALGRTLFLIGSDNIQDFLNLKKIWVLIYHMWHGGSQFHSLPGLYTPKSYLSASMMTKITLDFFGRHILAEEFTSFKICAVLHVIWKEQSDRI
jgi:hypothetical protein